ncbi:hypothetical protein ACIQC8_05020 [Agrococcus sediminis]|uniref:hypothetical protein n=1 Tax=Agrococcus TaxID=46352 RepID=UPI001FF1887D|nr:hypothetical protein [Agrococcus sp. SCSIO52902]UOW00547.1 hypothetical protein MU522_11570 [Agrococcus sp. SCSIO52902]
MQLYSSRPVAAAWQVVADLAAIATIAVSVWIALQVRDAIASLGGFGRQIEDAGTGFSTTLSDAGDALAQVPLIGDGVAQPFRDASGSADDLAAAGTALTSTIELLAATVGTALWLLPTLLVLLVWLLPRLRFATRARASAALARTREGRDLLALRAVATQPTRRLLATVADPVAAIRTGDEPGLRALAALELRSAGVRVAVAGPGPGTGPGAGVAAATRKGRRP